MLKSFKFCASLFPLLCITLAQPAWSVESELWKQFKAAQQEGFEPILPDFSYAGYDYSYTQLPDTRYWPRFNVAHYGAIPDDGGYDDQAIQAAIDAAETEGRGIVFFPPGRFKVSPNNNVDEQITITGSNIVLQGSGSGEGGTEIFMDQMKPKREWHMFHAFSPNGKRKKITTVIENAPRESNAIVVADPSDLVRGQKIMLWQDSVDYGEIIYSPQQIFPKWTTLKKSGFRIREIHTVAGIYGNYVVLAEPLHTDMIVGLDDDIEVRTHFPINNVGFENILFKGNWNSYPEKFKHHKDNIHDYGWNALRLSRVENSWVRDCEFKDWNVTLHIDYSSAITVSDVLLSGKRGHTSIHVRNSYGVLVKDSEDTAGHQHGPGVGFWGTGAVYLRYKMKRGQSIDAHSGGPYATLMDNVSNGNFGRNGGPHRLYPNHGRHFVAWNFEVAGGPRFYDFWRERRNLNTYAMPYFAGLHGKTVGMKEGTFAANESPGQRIEPASLFEAQLGLKMLPDYNYCCSAGETRTFDEPVDVVFGANGEYAYLYNVTGEVTFNDDFFGGPIPFTENIKEHHKSGFFRPAQ